MSPSYIYRVPSLWLQFEEFGGLPRETLICYKQNLVADSIWQALRTAEYWKCGIGLKKGHINLGSVLNGDAGCCWFSKKNPRCSTADHALISCVKVFRKDLWEAIRFRWGYRGGPSWWAYFPVRRLFSSSLVWRAHWGGKHPQTRKKALRSNSHVGTYVLDAPDPRPTWSACLLFYPHILQYFARAADAQRGLRPRSNEAQLLLTLAAGLATVHVVLSKLRQQTHSPVSTGHVQGKPRHWLRWATSSWRWSSALFSVLAPSLHICSSARLPAISYAVLSDLESGFHVSATKS